MDIYLIGYMGSGKSTIGQLLASKINKPFLDFDAYIEAQEGMSISQIFDKKGEIYFRKIEMKYVRELVIQEHAGRVIALGGGTPCYGGTMDMLNDQKIKTVYLNVPFQSLAKRLWSAKNTRPLVAGMQNYDELEDFVRKHLFERSYFYNQAETRLKIDKEATTDEIVLKIVATLF